ncbi:MAG: VWA domain-containing protein [Sandaracinaceae bacterium]|nr:VWA domain-containing protein [Sandaracinaceae bacterium]
MLRRLASLLLALALCACDGRAPGPATWRDRDASPPDGSFGIVGMGGGLAGGGGGGAPRPAPGDCGGRVLVVFDRSGSMNEPWTVDGASRPRWRVAADAVSAALEPLAARLEVGAILFPTGGAHDLDLCAEVAPIEAQLPFGPGASFLAAWDARWASGVASGSTPLDPAFARADEALRDAPARGVAVVLLTDGMPTCSEAPHAWDRAASWSARGIATWVVGLPGAHGLATLDRVAAAGGTGASLSVDEPAALGARLAEIAGEAAEQGCR